MNILVTGGLGFIGSYFVKLLVKDECCPVIIDKMTYAADISRLKGIESDAYIRDRLHIGDICNDKFVSKTVKSNSIDTIVNFAADTHVDRSIASSNQFIQSNIVGVQVLLEISRRHDLKFIQISTDEVYGSIEKGSFKETDKLNPGNPYCLPPGTKILLENGREINIENITETDRILSLEKKTAQTTLLDLDNSLGESSIYYLSSNNRLISKFPKKMRREYNKNLIEIKTEQGIIKCTPEHVLLIKRPKRFSNSRLDNRQSFNGLPVIELPASEIRKGDWLIHVRKVNFQGKVTYGKYFWRFAGYFIGDGNIGTSGKKSSKCNNYIHLADEDKELLFKYDKIIRKLTFDKYAYEKYLEIRGMGKIPDYLVQEYADKWGLNFSRVKHWYAGDRNPVFHAIPSYYKHKTKNCWYLSFGHKDIIESLCSLGMNIEARKKVVPDILFDSTDEEISEFIAGYFDADGSIYNHLITFSSSSNELLEGVKCLLRRFGIVSTITKELIDKKDSNDSLVIDENGNIEQYEMYRLTISDNSSKQLFKDNIKIFKDHDKVNIGRYQENMFHENIYYSNIIEIEECECECDCVYDLEVDETHNFAANGFLVHNSATKSAADLLCLSYCNTYGLDISITRSSNNYGIGQHEEKFVPRMISLGLEGKDLEVYGTGKNIRDWLWVEDNCLGILEVMKKGLSGEIYNIGAGNEMTNNQVAEIIADKLDVGIKFIQDRKGHDFRYSIDSGKIKDELGWRPVMDFEIGLDKTIEYYVGHAKGLEATRGYD